MVLSPGASIPPTFSNAYGLATVELDEFTFMVGA
jgi:hypothetical protein